MRPRSAVSDRAITERVAFRVDGHVVVPTNVLDERVTSGHDGQARRTIRLQSDLPDSTYMRGTG